jgi:CheY-like chemotaxis protein
MKILRILCADDDKDLQRHMVNALLECGHQVTAFANGRLLLDEILREPRSFDLVVTDNRMPFMSGIEVLQEMRKHSDLRDVPVIVASVGLGEWEIVQVENLRGVYVDKCSNIYETIPAAIPLAFVEVQAVAV